MTKTSTEILTTMMGDAPSQADLLEAARIARYQRVAGGVFVATLAMLAFMTVLALMQSDRTAKQEDLVGRALSQLSPLDKSASQAFMGAPAAFMELEASSDSLIKNLNALRLGDDSMSVEAAPSEMQADVQTAVSSAEKISKNVKIMVVQKAVLTGLGEELRTLSQRVPELLGGTESVLSLKLQKNASAKEIAMAGEFVLLAQRVSKSTNGFLMDGGLNADAVAALEKDLAAIREMGVRLKDGEPNLKLKPSREKDIDERISGVLQVQADIGKQTVNVVSNLAGIAAAQLAKNQIVVEVGTQQKQLEQLRRKLSKQVEIDDWMIVSLVLTSLLSLLAVVTLVYLKVLDGRRRQIEAEKGKLAAQAHELEARRVNKANQAAILRLMNEMQKIAAGDLTHEVTVTEDITGAIADSVNYTVEEIRALVGHVKKASTLVTSTTGQVESSSTQLLSLANQQLVDIHQAGKAVLSMAERITDVSRLADESSDVAKQFLLAANSGLSAVQSTMGGMNTIRNQIQETAKRMKRLGESSQEIGEITDLISDITEQTNVLALNAAIQAASAGEAGRGFTVVAEEVQRLAERSGDATRQITNLVKAIQADTQEVVASMEASTRGVVAGAQLSENAGEALAEIDRISQQLTDLIGRISVTTTSEAKEANAVASTIQSIFVSTKKTSDGTKANADMVRELSAVASELKKSVARFKLA